MSIKDAEQTVKQVRFLLVHSRQVRANRKERVRAVGSPKAARDLLLDLGHPQRLLGQVVGERHALVGQKRPICSGVCASIAQMCGAL